MNNFLQISVNVGTRVGDTSGNFQTTINQYINQRYLRIFKKFNWPTIVPAYAITTVSGVSDYALPVDFKHELYVYDSTNFKDIRKKDLQELERINPQALNQSGASWNYSIYEALSPQTATFNDIVATFGASLFTFAGNYTAAATLTKFIRFYQNPTSSWVIQIPYVKQAIGFSASTDQPIIDMGDLACELGATADAWRTKRQFEKATDFEMQYEQVVMEMIWSIENDPNRVVQFRPNVYPIHQLY